MNNRSSITPYSKVTRRFLSYGGKAYSSLMETWFQLFFLMLLSVSGRAMAVELEQVMARRAENGTDMVLQFSGRSPSIQAMSLGKPDRVVLSLPGVKIKEGARFHDDKQHTLLVNLANATDAPVTDAFIKGISVEKHLQSTRLILSLDKPMSPSISRQGHNAVVHLSPRVKKEQQPFPVPLEMTLKALLDLPPNADPSKRISLDVTELPIKSALMMLGESAGIDLLVAQDVVGKLSLVIHDLPWPEILALILDGHDLVSQRHGHTLVISKKSKLVSANTPHRQGDEGVLSLVLYPLKYAKAESLASLIRTDKGAGLLSARGSVLHDSRTNQLLITDTSSRLAVIKQSLEKLDIPQRQVQIEARIVVARENVSRRLGIRWGQLQSRKVLGNSLPNFSRHPSVGSLSEYSNADNSHPVMGMHLDLGNAASAVGALGLGFIDKNVQVGLELNALELEGLSQTLSQPRVMTLEREAAKIRQGQEIPYQRASKRGSTSTSFRDAVLALEVLPHIMPDQQVLMTVDIQNDSVASDLFNGLPAINTNRINTQVVVDNGETVVLGGILSQKQTNDLRKIPWLGDIPGLGKLFRYAEKAHEQVELLVFITPNIINE